MSSIGEDDPTLPLNFDGSTNLDQLVEVTFGPHLEYPDGSVPMVTKAGSGRMSPVRSRTMKEYDQQLADLKKENFSLKLRIYFLEERVQAKFDGDSELLFKTATDENIELKVEMQSLKNELVDKQDLLKKASSALESIGTQHQVEQQRAREQPPFLEAARKRVVELEAQQQHSHEELTSCRQQLEQLRQQLDDAHRPISSERRSDSGQQSTLSNVSTQQLDLETAIAERDRVIGELRSELDASDRPATDRPATDRPSQLLQLTREMEEKDRQIQSLRSQLSGANSRRSHDSSTEHSMTGYRERVGELEVAAGRLTGDLADKDQMIRKLEGIISDRDASSTELSERLEELEQQRATHVQNVAQRDKTINGLVGALHGKENELKKVTDQLLAAQERLNEANKRQSSEGQRSTEGREAARVVKLEAMLKELQQENELLQKTIGVRDAEIQTVMTRLARSEEAVAERDADVQDSRSSVPGDAAQRSATDADTLPEHYKALLEEMQIQVENRERTLQNLTKSLRDKDCQLLEYISMASEQEPRVEQLDAVIMSLRRQIEEKDQDVEDRYKAQEAREYEARQLRLSLRERDHDIERANQMLMTTEETIDTLESEAKEKEQHVKRLAAMLAAQQTANQDAAASNAHALDEREAMIRTLRDSLARKERGLQEVAGDAVDSSLARQLQQRLHDKEMLLQDIMSERSKTAELSKKAMTDMLQKLQDKDADIQEVQDQANHDAAELNKRLIILQSDVKKKEHKLQMVENESIFAEGQQQEMLERIRSALKEKDKTIEALVESGREKDKLFCQLKASAPDGPDGLGGGGSEWWAGPSRLAQLHQLQDNVTQLSLQLSNRDDLIGRLQIHLTSEKAGGGGMDTVESRELAALQAELASRTQALTKTLCAEKEARRQVRKLTRALSEQQQRDRPEERTGNDDGAPCSAEQLRRPGSLEGTRTAMGSDAAEQESQAAMLRAARQVELYFSTLPRTSAGDATRSAESEKSELSRELDSELSAVRALRLQLESSRSEPESLLRAAELESLRAQLEESRRWNSSLAARSDGAGRPRGEEGGTARPSLQSVSYLPSFRALPDADGASLVDDLQHQVAALERRLVESRGGVDRAERDGSGVGGGDRDHTPERDGDGVQTVAPPGVSVASLHSQLEQTERVNAMLKEQIRLSAGRGGGGAGTASNPELVVQMAQEIERLKDELAHARADATSGATWTSAVSNMRSLSAKSDGDGVDGSDAARTPISSTAARTSTGSTAMQTSVGSDSTFMPASTCSGSAVMRTSVDSNSTAVRTSMTSGSTAMGTSMISGSTAMQTSMDSNSTAMRTSMISGSTAMQTSMTSGTVATPASMISGSTAMQTSITNGSMTTPPSMISGSTAMRTSITSGSTAVRTSVTSGADWAVQTVSTVDADSERRPTRGPAERGGDPAGLDLKTMVASLNLELTQARAGVVSGTCSVCQSLLRRLGELAAFLELLQAAMHDDSFNLSQLSQLSQSQLSEMSRILNETNSFVHELSLSLYDVGSFMAGRESILELSNLLHFSVVGDVSLSGGLTPRKADSWQLEAYRRAVCQTPQHSDRVVDGVGAGGEVSPPGVGEGVAALERLVGQLQASLSAQRELETALREEVDRLGGSQLQAETESRQLREQWEREREARSALQAQLEQAAGESTRALANRDTAVGQLAEREEALRQLTQSLGKREEVVQQLTQSLGKRDNVVQQLTQSLGEKEEVVQQLSRSLGEREGTVQQLTQSLGEREEVVRQLTEALGEKELALQQLQARLDSAAVELAEKSDRVLRQHQKLRLVQRRLSRLVPGDACLSVSSSGSDGPCSVVDIVGGGESVASIERGRPATSLLDAPSSELLTSAEAGDLVMTGATPRPGWGGSGGGESDDSSASLTCDMSRYLSRSSHDVAAVMTAAAAAATAVGREREGDGQGGRRSALELTRGEQRLGVEQPAVELPGVELLWSVLTPQQPTPQPAAQQPATWQEAAGQQPSAQTQQQLQESRLYPSSQQLTSQQLMSQQLTSQQLQESRLYPSSQQLASQQLTPQQLQESQLYPSSQQLASQQLTPQQQMSQQLTPQQQMSQQLTPQQQMSQQLTPQQLMSQQLTPQQLMSQQQLFQSQLEAADRLTAALRLSGGASASPGGASEQLTLVQHLEEIRTLRLRLEQSIRTNDLLREQLERQLASSARHGVSVHETSCQGGHTDVTSGSHAPSRRQSEAVNQLTLEQQQHSQQLQELKQQLQHERQQQEQQSEQLKQRHDELQKLKQQNQQLQLEKQQLQQQSKQLQQRERLLAQEIVKQKQQRDEQQQQRDDERQQSQQQSQQLQQQSQQLQQQSQHLQQQSQQLQRLEEQQGLLKEERKEQDGRRQQLALREEELTEREGRLVGQKEMGGGERGEVEREVAALRRELEERDRDLATVSRHADDMSRELTAARRAATHDTHGTHGTHDMYSEVEELRRQVALRAAEVRDRESELCLQQMALQEARHGQQQLTREYEVVSADLLAYRTKIETLTLKVTGLTDQLAETRQLNSTLSLELGVTAATDRRDGGATPVGGELLGSRTDNLTLDLLMVEIRKLRQQLQQTIDNNNLLREKLDEQLAAATLTATLTHTLTPRLTPKLTPTLTTGESGSGLAVPKLTADGGSDQAALTTANSSAQAAVTDALTSALTDAAPDAVTSAPTDPATGRLSVVDGRGPAAERGWEADGGRERLEGRGNGQRNGATHSAADLIQWSPSQHQTEHLQMLTSTPACYQHQLNGFSAETRRVSARDSPGRPSGILGDATNSYLSSPPTKLAGSSSSSVSLQRRADAALDASDRCGAVLSGQLARLQQGLPRGQLSTDAVVVAAADGDADRSGSWERRERDAWDEDGDRPGVGGGGGGRYPFPSKGVTYSILDPCRPPNCEANDSSAHSNNTGLQDSADASLRRIGSDLRSLYTICVLDDFELLKKEIDESHVMVAGMESRVTGRLQSYRQCGVTKSVDASTMRELSHTLGQLRITIGTERQLVARCWHSELPPRHVRAAEMSLRVQNKELRDEVAAMRTKYGYLKHELKAALKKLQNNNKMKLEVERHIIKQLSKTKSTMENARTGLDFPH